MGQGASYQDKQFCHYDKGHPFYNILFVHTASSKY